MFTQQYNLYWICLFLVILLTAMGSQVSADVDLKAAYDFSEGSGSTTVDGSGNGNTGTITGATWSNTGFKGNCLDFNGSGNYVSVSDSSSLDITLQMTLEAWVNPRSLPVSGEWRIIDKRVNVDAYMLAVGPNYVRGGFASDEIPQQYYYAQSNVTLPTNQWTHLAVTYDSAQVKIYVNGVLGDTINAPGKNVKVTGDTLYLAKDFNGRVDQVRIYSRARTQEEIAQIVVRGHYRFNEGTGTTTYDNSGYNNDGSISNASWASQPYLAFEGSCLTFDSSLDMVTIPDSESLDIVGKFTLSAWVNPHSLPGSGEWRIIDKRVNVDAYMLAVGPNYVRGGFASDEVPQQYYYAQSNVTLPTNQWTHLAVTYDSAQVKIYVNGVLGDTINAPGKNVKVTGDTLYLAKGFDGEVDQIQIIGLAFSAYEVKSKALRGFWGFEEGTGTSSIDYSDNSNTATLNNGATWSTLGVRGNCLSLDGVDDYVSVAAKGSIQPYDAITVEAWISPDILSSTNWSSVVAKWWGTSSYWLIVKSGELLGGFYGTDSNFYQANAYVTIPTGKWSHVAMTYDGSYVRVFLNGGEVGSSAATGKKIAVNNDILQIGSRGTGAENFDGKIDEVCILSIAKNYNVAGMLASEGATASLEYGSYPIANTIYLLSYQTLEGRGPDRTILRLNDSVNNPVICTYHNNESIYPTTPDHDYMIRRFSIEGNSANNQGVVNYYPMGIALPNTYNFTIKEVYVRDTRGYAGIITWPNHGAYQGGGITIKNYILYCLVTGTVNPGTGAYGVGIYVTGFDQKNILIGRNTCNNNQGTGIFLEDYQSYMDVVGNTCTYNGSSGIWLGLTSYTNVLHNVIENNAARGILLDGGAGAGGFIGTVSDVVSYNTVRTNSYEGIFHYDSGTGVYNSYCVFKNNTVENNNNGQFSPLYGVTLRNVKYVTLDGNISRDTRPTRWQYYGIATEGSADYNTITNNDLRQNKIGGLTYVGINNTISGNKGAYDCTSTTVTTGSVYSGSHTDLHSDNGVYFTVGSNTSGTRTTDWYATTTIAENRSIVDKLTITYDGKYSISRTQYLYLWNYNTSAWEQIDSATVGTTDVTRTWTTTDTALIQKYISSTGEIRVRVYASGGSTTFYCYGDYLVYAIEY